MATLSTVLERAVRNPHVPLEADAQRAVWQLGERAPRLRAALAASARLDPQMRHVVASEREVSVRQAFLSRADLSAEEIGEAVRAEKRTSVLVQVAAETQNPELLQTLAGKGGKRLQLTVALNPAAADDVRLAAAQELLSSDQSLSWRLRRPVQILLAECVPARRFVLNTSTNYELLVVALPLAAVTDGVDVKAVLQRVLDLASGHAGSWSANTLLSNLAQYRWQMSPQSRKELASLAERSSRNDYSTSQLRRTLQTPEDKQRREYLSLVEAVTVCRDSRDPAKLVQASSQLRAWHSELNSMFSLLGTLALLQNPATPLGVLGEAFAQNSDVELRRRLSLPAHRSDRTDAVLLATSYEVDPALLASVDVDEVIELVSADSCWSGLLVQNLVKTGRLTSANLDRVPLASLPDELPAEVLKLLTAQLGARIADPAWLQAALALSSQFDGCFADLVGLIDCV